MLFDLRGRGRRNTIKVIYVSLAILMGGGLVFFGIGGDVSGGLVDAITERGATGDDGTKRLERRERDARAAIQRNKQDSAAWTELIRARTSLSRLGDNFDDERQRYTGAGRAKLQQAASAWEEFQSLDLPVEDKAQVARIMVSQVYAPGALEDAEKAAEAQEVVAEANPKDSTYEQLAVLAYAAGQTRKGDLAKEKALELAPKDEKEALRGRIESAAAQATQAGAEEQIPVPTPSPSPSGG